MEDQNQQSSISVKVIFNFLRDWSKRLLKNWYWILAIASLLAFIVGFLESKKKTTYTCESTFMVANDDGASGGGGLSMLLGTFGMGEGNLGGYNLNKLRTVAYSNTVIDKVLMDTITMNGKQDIIGNFIIDVEDVHERWKESESLHDYWLELDPATPADSVDDYKSALSSLRDIYLGTLSVAGIVHFSADQEIGICKLKATTRSDKLSLAICNSHYNQLTNTYNDMSRKAKELTLSIVQNKEDSIRGELAETEQQLAYIQDRNKGVIFSSDRMIINQLTRKIYTLNALLAEVVKNKETAQFLLDSESDFLQIIDWPEVPAQRSKPKVIFRTIIGFILGLIFGTIILFVVLWIKDALREDAINNS